MFKVFSTYICLLKKMQHLKVSGAVQPLKWSLGVKWLKKYLAGKNFDDDDEVEEKVMTWSKGQAADFYDSEIEKLGPRLNKCLDNAGD